MCSPLERADRQAHMELHSLECTPSTYRHNPRHRVAEPNLCVKKYRRSAAGGGVRSYDDDGRTVDALAGTIDYLLGALLPRQRTFGDDVMPPRTLAETAAFVDDRVRAVQVDLITSLGGLSEEEEEEKGRVPRQRRRRSAAEWVRVRGVQARLVRYGILMQYLLTDLSPRKYEAKFGWTALRTALGAYFTAWDALETVRSASEDGDDDDDDVALTELDEIRSYAALLHLSSVLRAREVALPAPTAGIGCVDENGSGFGALLASSSSVSAAANNARRRRRSGGACGEEKKEGTGGAAEDRWLWSLEVASAADSGNYVRMFHLLCDDDQGDDSGEVGAGAARTRRPGCASDEVRRWRILSRCCVLSAVGAARLGLLRRYNKALGKNERVPAADLARLLRLPSAESAARFCGDAGLPLADGGAAVTMKAAPIAVTTEGDAARMMGGPGREEDEFVFGDGYREVWEGKRVAPKRKTSRADAPAPVAQQKKSEAKKDAKKGKDPTAGMSSLQLALMKMKIKEEGPPPAAAAAEAERGAPDDWEDREDDAFEDVEAKSEDNNAKDDDDEKNGDLERETRTDDDGVVVPPGRILLDLLR